jgi:DNA repair protein RadC
MEESNMKRISTNYSRLTRNAANRIISELRSTQQRPSRNHGSTYNSGLPSFFVSESGATRYLTEQDAKARRPMSEKLTSPQKTIEFCRHHFRPVIEQSLQEEFYILTLDSTNKVIRTHGITVGLVNMSHVHAREVFRPAILDAATSIIAAHNHPSGDSQPSEADRRVTRSLIKAGAILGIKLLDHVVLARDGSWSFREHLEEMFVSQD